MPLTASLVAGLTVLRLLVAANTPMAPDETYYWVWSRALAGGYLDHPPMVALWIRAGIALLGQSALGVRVAGPIAAGLASWLLFDAAERLFPGRRAGLAAVALLNATLLLGVGSVIMTPDSPLLFFWTATLWAMVRLIDSGTGGWWLVAGLFAGLALDSKYTGLFLWIGIGLWVLLPANRRWLRCWQPWAAIALGAACFTPVVVWNAAHGWAGLLRQGGRVGDWRPMRAVGFEAELLGSQVGLVTPWIWGLCVAGLVVALRRCRRPAEPGWALLLALTLPALLVFLEHAVGDRVQGNWPAILYPALAVAAAGYCAGRRDGQWIGAACLGLAITGLAYLQASLALFPLPPRLDPIAQRLSGWDGLGRQVAALQAETGSMFVTADNYATDSELAWWLPPEVAILGTDARWGLTQLASAPLAGQTGLLVRNAGRTDPPDPTRWAGTAVVGSVQRPGLPFGFTILRVTARPDAPAAIALPRR